MNVLYEPTRRTVPNRSTPPLLGISQSELARHAGTTQTVISRLEGGAVTPTLPLLHRIAGALEGELNLKITGTSTHAEFPLAS